MADGVGGGRFYRKIHGVAKGWPWGGGVAMGWELILSVAIIVTSQLAFSVLLP